MKKTGKSREKLILLLIIIAAAAVRLPGIGWGLPDLFEEATPMLKAWKMWGWGKSHSLDLNPHFFNYPSLTIYIQFIVQGLLYAWMRLLGVISSTTEYQALFIVDKSAFVYAARSVTVLAGTGSVWAIYRIGKMISGRLTAIFAAILLAINVFHISKSQSVEVDIPMTFLLLLSIWAVLRILSKNGKGSYILAGCAIGLATSAKYTALLTVFPLIAAYLYSSRSTANKKGENRKGYNRAQLLPLLMAFVSILIVFILTSPYTILDYSTFSQHLSLEREHMSIGHFGVDTANTPGFYLSVLAGTILGWPLTILGISGLIYFLVYRREKSVVIIGCFLIPYLASILSWSMKADRYLMPVFPFLILFASMLLSRVLRSKSLGKLVRPLRLAAVSAIILLIAIPLLAFYPAHFKRFQPDTRTLAREWIEENIPSGSFIVLESYGPEFIKPQVLITLDDEERDIVFKMTSGTSNYAVQPVPMFQTYPERSAPFYDLELYDDADIIITSSAVRSRYATRPAKFSRQLEFYRSLEERYLLVQEFTSSDGTGPTLTIFWNPDHKIPFGGRNDHSGPGSLDYRTSSASGSEELFYLDMGLNYEVFGFYTEAIESYIKASEYPVIRPASYNSLVLGITRCFLATDQIGRALIFLDAAAADAPSAASREQFRRMSSSIRAKSSKR